MLRTRIYATAARLLRIGSMRGGAAPPPPTPTGAVTLLSSEAQGFALDFTDNTSAVRTP